MCNNANRQAALTQAMFDIYQQAVQVGYHPHYFAQMVDEQGGYDTAIHLIHALQPSAGYTALYERGHLDLTVEALVLRPEWDDIFSDRDRQAAYHRLAQYGYAFPEDAWHPPA